MSEYIPTTEEVKANYALVGDDEVVNSINEQKFDRWLEQHDKEVEQRIIELPFKHEREDDGDGNFVHAELCVTCYNIRLMGRQAAPLIKGENK